MCEICDEYKNEFDVNLAKEDVTFGNHYDLLWMDATMISGGIEVDLMVGCETVKQLRIGGIKFCPFCGEPLEH